MSGKNILSLPGIGIGIGRVWHRSIKDRLAYYGLKLKQEKRMKKHKYNIGDTLFHAYCMVSPTNFVININSVTGLVWNNDKECCYVLEEDGNFYGFASEEQLFTNIEDAIKYIEEMQ